MSKENPKFSIERLIEDITRILRPHVVNFLLRTEQWSDEADENFEHLLIKLGLRESVTPERLDNTITQFMVGYYMHTKDKRTIVLKYLDKEVQFPSPNNTGAGYTVEWEEIVRWAQTLISQGKKGIIRNKADTQKAAIVSFTNQVIRSEERKAVRYQQKGW